MAFEMLPLDDTTDNRLEESEMRLWLERFQSVAPSNEHLILSEGWVSSSFIIAEGGVSFLLFCFIQ